MSALPKLRREVDRHQHSKVGASGRQRWSVCPGSVALVATMPAVTQSSYAEWGSEAHDYAEKALRFILEGGPKPGPIPDPEMQECVTAYLECVGQVLANYHGEERRIWIEARFTLPVADGEAYGTVDFAVYFPRLKHLVVVDLKTGSGLMVPAYENKQLLYYAVAAMFEEFLEVRQCVLAISQPRAPEGLKWSEWEVTGTRLFEELGTIRNEILATMRPDAPLVSGDHCAKSFCPAMAVCPARKQEAYALAIHEFTPVKTYDPAELARCFLAVDRIEAWCKAVSQFAHAEAFAGRTPPGLKLVNKRLGDRKWKNEAEAAKKLESYAASSDAIDAPNTAEVLTNLYKRKLVSPAQADALFKKVMGAKKFGNALARKLTDPDADGTLVLRESTGTTLVPESDDRPAAILDGTSDFVASQITQESSE